ncbi:MAG: DASS family sodium-coupled anion symporter [Deltaproteobacteria bacterium]|nr:DASS family sodium-coupled anion symporter [Deltaproteobacteria bacterium]
MKPALKNGLLLTTAIGMVPLAMALPLPMALPTRIGTGIFLLALLLWVTEAIPLYVTSFLILFFQAALLAPALHISHAPFLAPFFSDIIALFLGGLLLAEAGHKYRIDEWFAEMILKGAGSRPAHVLLALMLTTAFLSMWMSNTATTAMMLLIVGAIAGPLGPGHPFAKAFFLGIPFAANLGGMMTPVGTPPNAIAMQAINNHFPGSMTFLKWMAVSCPIVILLLVLLWGLLLILYPPPQTAIATHPGFHIDLNRATLMVIAVFHITALLWLTSSLHGLSPGTVALIPAIIFLSLGILDKHDFKRISWDVLFLVGGGLALSAGMDKSGLNDFLVQTIPFAKLSPLALLVVFILTGAILTTFMSNTATANLIIPLTFIIPAIPGPSLAVCVALVVSSTMILPVSTPPNAIAYGSGIVTMKEMALAGFLISLFSALLMMSLGSWWWKLLGL